MQCTPCVKLFFHPGCASKHRTCKENEIVKCEGPFAEIVVESDKTEMKKPAAGDGWDQ